MNCPKCQHSSAEGACFCAQCGAALTQSATSPVPAAQPSSGSKVAVAILGVILGLVLLFVVGIYVAFHVVASKVRALAGGNAQATEQPQGASSNPSDAQQGANVGGSLVGSMLGTDAKGKSDITRALNNASQAAAQIEQHDKATGNTTGAPDAIDTQQAMGAAGGLLSALGHSLGGARRHDPVDFHILETLLPASLPGMERGVPIGHASAAMGIKESSAEVDFNDANSGHINVSIEDATAVSGLAGLAGMAQAEETEQGGSFEKDASIDGRRVHEKWEAQARHGELSLIVAKRYGVDVHGDNVPMDALLNALGQVDLGRLEAMKDVNPQAQ